MFTSDLRKALAEPSLERSLAEKIAERLLFKNPDGSSDMAVLARAFIEVQELLGKLGHELRRQGNR